MSPAIILAICDDCCAVSEGRRPTPDLRISEVARQRLESAEICLACLRVYLVLCIDLVVGLDIGLEYKLEPSVSSSSVSKVDFGPPRLRIQLKNSVTAVITLWRQKCSPRVVFREPTRMKKGTQTHAVTMPNSQ